MVGTLSTLAVKLTANIRDLKVGLTQASGQITTFATKNSAQLRSVGLAAGLMGGAIVGAMALAVREAANFESAITNAAAVTGAMGDDLDEAKRKMSELAKTLGETTVFSAREAANAMYDLASKGFDPATMAVSDLQPFLDLAAATQSELAMTTETVTASIRAFGLTTKESGRVADVFAKTIASSAATMDKFAISMSYVAPIAKTTGVSLEETAAALGKIFDLGFPASMAGTALRRSLAELLSPTEKTTDILNSLGLSIKDVSTNTHGLVGVLRNLDKAEIGSSQVMDMFGQRSGPVINALLEIDASGKKAYESIRKLTEANINAGGEAARIATVQLESFNNKLKLLKSAVQSLQIAIGNELLPTLKEMVDGLAQTIRGMKEWMDENPKLAENIIIATSALGGFLVLLGVLTFTLPTAVAGIGLLKVGFMGLAGALLGIVSALKISLLALAPVGASMGALLITVVGLTVAIVLAAQKLSQLATAFIEARKAAEGARKAHKDAENAYLSFSRVVDNAKRNIKNMTDEEKTQVEILDRLVKNYEQYIKMEDQDEQLKKRLQKQIVAQGRKIADISKAHEEETAAIKNKNIVSNELYKLQKELEEEIAKLTKSSSQLKIDAFNKELEAYREKIMSMKNLSAEEQEVLLGTLQTWEEAKLESLRSTKGFVDEVGEGYFKISRDADKVFGEMPRVVEQSAIAMRDNMDDFFFDAFTGELESSGEYFRAWGRSMLKSFSSMISDMIARWIFFGEVTKGGGGGKSGIFGALMGVAGLAIGGMAGSAAAAVPGMGGDITSFAQAGTAFPEVVPGAGTASALSGGFAAGIDNVPKEGYYRLHRDETVTPKEDKGGRGITIINLIDEKMVPAIVMKYPGAILNIVNEDILRSGQTRKNIKEA